MPPLLQFQLTILAAEMDVMLAVVHEKRCIRSTQLAGFATYVFAYGTVILANVVETIGIFGLAALCKCILTMIKNLRLNVQRSLKTIEGF